MIIKSYELNKIDVNTNKIFLMYGQNEGLKNEITKKYFINNFKENIYRYDEKEIIDNNSDFFNEFFRDLFSKKKNYLLFLE